MINNLEYPNERAYCIIYNDGEYHSYSIVEPNQILSTKFTIYECVDYDEWFDILATNGISLDDV